MACRLARTNLGSSTTAHARTLMRLSVRTKLVSAGGIAIKIPGKVIVKSMRTSGKALFNSRNGRNNAAVNNGRLRMLNICLGRKVLIDRLLFLLFRKVVRARESF